MNPKERVRQQATPATERQGEARCVKKQMGQQKPRGAEEIKAPSVNAETQEVTGWQRARRPFLQEGVGTSVERVVEFDGRQTTAPVRS